MNRFFRRFRQKQIAPDAPTVKQDGAKLDGAKQDGAAQLKAQTPPVQNTDANFALSSENDTPKTHTLTASEPKAAKLHTATVTATSTAPATARISSSKAIDQEVAAANEIAAVKDVPPNPALPAAPATQAPPEARPTNPQPAQAVPASSNNAALDGEKTKGNADQTGGKAAEKTEPQFALSAEADTPKTLTLTTPTPNHAALHTATPIDAQSQSQAKPQAQVQAQPPSQAPATPVAVPQPRATQSKGTMNSTNGKALIQLNDVNKAYQTPVGEFIALRGINLTIGRGEFVAVVGKSGSGKSTLINMITGIDRPSSGEIFIEDTPIHNLAEGPMAEWRGRNVGIIFQFFQLLPMLSCIENVMLPMDFCNMFKPSERESRALHLLEQVDMVEHAYKLPSEVSGGQQQRVAIARALANDPPLLVADEPTGNLDSRTADAVFQLFARMVDDGKTILMVTHDDEMAHQVRRTITLTDGQIVDQQYHTQQTPAPPTAANEEQTAIADPAGIGV